MSPRSAPRFREVQPISKNRISYVILVVAIPFVVGLSYLMVKQLVLGIPLAEGPKAPPDAVLAFLGGLVLIPNLALLYLFFFGKLITEVYDDSIHVHLTPLAKKRIYSLTDIATVEARTYKPIAEFGGWGIRKGKEGDAFNISGDRGVQLVFVDGKRLLIGSNKAKILESALRSRRST